MSVARVEAPITAPKPPFYLKGWEEDRHRSLSSYPLFVTGDNSELRIKVPNVSSTVVLEYGERDGKGMYSRKFVVEINRGRNRIALKQEGSPEIEAPIEPAPFEAQVYFKGEVYQTAQELSKVIGSYLEGVLDRDPVYQDIGPITVHDTPSWKTYEPNTSQYRVGLNAIITALEKIKEKLDKEIAKYVGCSPNDTLGTISLYLILPSKITKELADCLFCNVPLDWNSRTSDYGLTQDSKCDFCGAAYHFDAQRHSVYRLGVTAAWLPYVMFYGDEKYEHEPGWVFCNTGAMVSRNGKRMLRG